MNSSTSHSTLLKPYYPAFDGLRAIAFFMVFAVHYVMHLFSSRLVIWGWAGTDLFFVLSGFLITGILFDSLGKERFFRVFYIRRSLRIFPLFYAFWIALLLLTPVLHIIWNRYNFTMAAYVGNMFMAGKLHHADPGMIVYRSFHHPDVLRYISISPLWTLCVEEQFYLLWPAVIYFIRSRRVLLTLCVVTMILLPIIRLAVAHLHPDLVRAGFLYSSTWSRSDALLAGAVLALWLRGPAAPAPRYLRMGAISGFWVSVFLLAKTIHLVSSPDTNMRICTYGFSLTALASVCLLVIALDSKWLAIVLETKFMVTTGRMSYGLYLFHTLPFLYVVGLLEHASRMRGCFLVAASLLGTYALAWCSFRFLESPFLRLKSRFALRPDAIADPPADADQLAELIPSPE